MPAGLTRRLKEDEARLLGQFVDLLDKMLSLEPARRPSPKVRRHFSGTPRYREADLAGSPGSRRSCASRR